MGVWRVMDCAGQGSDETFVPAMFAAHEAGADIISMSLGDSRDWSETVAAVAAERLFSAGVIGMLCFSLLILVCFKLKSRI